MRSKELPCLSEWEDANFVGFFGTSSAFSCRMCGGAIFERAGSHSTGVGSTVPVIVRRV